MVAEKHGSPNLDKDRVYGRRAINLPYSVSCAFRTWGGSWRRWRPRTRMPSRRTPGGISFGPFRVLLTSAPSRGRVLRLGSGQRLCRERDRVPRLAPVTPALGEDSVKTFRRRSELREDTGAQ